MKSRSFAPVHPFLRFQLYPLITQFRITLPASWRLARKPGRRLKSKLLKARSGPQNLSARLNFIVASHAGPRDDISQLSGYPARSLWLAARIIGNAAHLGNKVPIFPTRVNPARAFINIERHRTEAAPLPRARRLMFHGEQSLPRSLWIFPRLPLRLPFRRIFSSSFVSPSSVTPAKRVKYLPCFVLFFFFFFFVQFLMQFCTSTEIILRKRGNVLGYACGRSTTFSRSSLVLLGFYCDFSRGRGTGTHHPWQPV